MAGLSSTIFTEIKYKPVNGRVNKGFAVLRLWFVLLVASLSAQSSAGASAWPAADDAILLHGGYVMTMDAAQKDIEQGEVLIRGGRIVAVGRDLAADGARRIDAGGGVILPGFVDTHSHLYVTTMRGQFRNQNEKFFPVSARLAAMMTPEDTQIAMYAGALELLDGGITTTADFFDNVRTREHAQAGLDALEKAGIRAQLFYGGPDKTTKNPIDVEHLGALAKRQHDRASNVSMGLAWRLPRDRSSQENWAMRQHEFETARRLGLPIQVHVSGEPGPMFDALIARGYLYPGLTVVHGTDPTAEQLAALERANVGISLTPISEHRVGFGLTRLDTFDGLSRLGLGIDGNSLAGSADMFATMRLAALTWSGAAKDESRPDPRKLLDLATRRGAQLMGLEREIGTLTVGKRADVQIIDLAALNFSGFGGGDPAALLMYSARPENVRTVLVNGRVLKLDGALVGVDLPEVIRHANASGKRLLQASPR